MELLLVIYDNIICETSILNKMAFTDLCSVLNTYFIIAQFRHTSIVNFFVELLLNSYNFYDRIKFPEI